MYSTHYLSSTKDKEKRSPKYTQKENTYNFAPKEKTLKGKK